MQSVLDPQVNKGQSRELTEGRAINLPGIYKHKVTGVINITAPGEEGVVMADALQAPVWQGNWERVGDVPTRIELQKMQKDQQIKDAKEEAERKKADEAELQVAVSGGETYIPESEAKKGK